MLELILNLSVALTLKPLLGKRRDYVRLYMPDYSWIAVVCGSFALVWSVLRTGLVIRAAVTPPPRRASMAQEASTVNNCIARGATTALTRTAAP